MARDHAVYRLLQCGKLGRYGNAIRADKRQHDHARGKADGNLAILPAVAHALDQVNVALARAAPACNQRRAALLQSAGGGQTRVSLLDGKRPCHTARKQLLRNVEHLLALRVAHPLVHAVRHRQTAQHIVKLSHR